jgi:hypothetical protein
VVAGLGLLAALSARTERAPAADLEGTPPRDEPAAREPDSKTRGTKPFWLDGGVGWQRLGLTTFRVDRNDAGDALTADLLPSVADGPTAHLGVGVRLSVLTLGVRAGVAAFQDSTPGRSVDTLQLYSLDAELGFRIPLGRVEPYLLLGGGYSAFGGLDDAIRGVGRGLAMDGANLRAGLGVDVFVSGALSLGARLSADVLFLSRPGVPIRDLATAQQVNTLGVARTRLLEGDGSSVGTAINLSIGPGIHF